jgi:hypothetical protein
VPVAGEPCGLALREIIYFVCADLQPEKLCFSTRTYNPRLAQDHSISSSEIPLSTAQKYRKHGYQSADVSFSRSQASGNKQADTHVLTAPT